MSTPKKKLQWALDSIEEAKIPIGMDPLRYTQYLRHLNEASRHVREAIGALQAQEQEDIEDLSSCF